LQKLGVNLTTILVSGLSRSINQDELHQLFEKHGSVLGVDLVDGQDFGYVRMTKEGEGKNAILALDGTLCSGVRLSVGAARAKQQREVDDRKVACATEVVHG
jgi:RNA recognition motif-containing protein